MTATTGDAIVTTRTAEQARLMRSLTERELEAVSGGGGTSETVKGNTDRGIVSGPAAGTGGEKHTAPCPNTRLT